MNYSSMSELLANIPSSSPLKGVSFTFHWADFKESVNFMPLLKVLMSGFTNAMERSYCN
jgi:hypothetical protein